jgi:hypothetical protein
VKRDLKDWCITKELTLDMRVKASNSCDRSLIFGSFFLLPFCQVFFTHFHFFDLAFYCLFSFFDLVFYHHLFSPLLFRYCFVPIFFFLTRVVSSLAYPNLLENKRLDCCCCMWNKSTCNLRSWAIRRNLGEKTQLKAQVATDTS